MTTTMMMILQWKTHDVRR